MSTEYSSLRPKTVVILAAGIGSRLFPLTQDRPKCLLDIGGTTLLDLQLTKAMRCGFTRAVISVGGFAQKVEEHVRARHYPAMDIFFEFNPFYYCSNNLISLWLTRHHMNAPFVLLNGDIAFSDSMLKKISLCSDPIALGVRSSSTFDDDDMKVIIRTNQVVRVSKTIPVAEANAESLGMSFFSQQGAGILANTLDRLVRDKDNMNQFYLSAFQTMINQGTPIAPCDLGDDPWFELDFPKDYEIMKQNIGLVINS